MRGQRFSLLRHGTRFFLRAWKSSPAPIFDFRALCFNSNTRNHRPSFLPHGPPILPRLGHVSITTALNAAQKSRRPHGTGEDPVSQRMSRMPDESCAMRYQETDLYSVLGEGTAVLYESRAEMGVGIR